MSKDGKKLLVALLGLIMVPILTVYEGSVLNLLWGWFLFKVTSIPAPGIVVCAGLSAILTLCTRQYQSKEKEGMSPEEVWDRILDSINATTVTLITGFVLHLFL